MQQAKEKINWDDAALKKMIAHREADALEYLYDRYAAVCYGLIRRIVNDDVIAESVLIRSFLHLADDIHHFHPGRISIFTWLINICRKLSLDQMAADTLLKQNYQENIDRLISTGSGSFKSSFNPAAVKVCENIGKMDPEYKRIIDLVYLYGLPLYETAKKMNIPLGTVRTRSHVSLLRLREIVLENLKEE